MTLSIFLPILLLSTTAAADSVKFSYNNTPYCLGMVLDPGGFFPCSGGASNSCPVALVPCQSPTAIWNTSSGNFCNTFEGPDGGACINVDCDSDEPGAVAKVIAGPNQWFSSLAFVGNQLVYTSRTGKIRCLNGGQQLPNPPCNAGEEYYSNQTTIDYCLNTTTTGWLQIPA